MRKTVLRKNATILLFVLLLCLCINNTVHAGTLAVTRREQERTNWCWVASAQIVGDFKTDTLYTQSQICKEIKGSVVNETASDSEVYNAIKYTTGSPVAMYSKISFSQFAQELDSQKSPVVICMIWKSLSAHNIVVSGCLYSNQSLRLTDPAAGCGNAWYSYADLCNGTTVQSGTGYYAMTWYLS